MLSLRCYRRKMYEHMRNHEKCSYCFLQHILGVQVVLSQLEPKSIPTSKRCLLTNIETLAKDMKEGIKEVNAKIDTKIDALSKDVKEVSKEVNARIDTKIEALSKGIKEGYHELLLEMKVNNVTRDERARRQFDGGRNG